MIDKYEDMYDMHRPASVRHRSMPIEDRAAQFASFAALTGHEEQIAETAREAEAEAIIGVDVRYASIDDEMDISTAFADDF